MSRYCVVADDLSGALDTAVKFREAGFKTTILTTARLPASREFDVVVFDTETRMVKKAEASRRITRMAKVVREFGLDLIYKKIDSTLRGNLGLELDALMDVLQLRCIIVVPSYPAQGRAVLNGCLTVRGRPLEETEFAREVCSPVVTSHVPTLLAKTSRHEVKHVGLGVLTRGGLEKELMEANACVVVVDAITNMDLKRIAASYMNLRQRRNRILIAGSAGLAQQLAPLLARPRNSVLIVCGSINKVSVNQTKRLRKRERMPDYVIGLDSDLARVTARVNKRLVSGKDLILRTALPRGLPNKGRIEEGERYSEKIGLVVGGLRGIGKVIILGGETAHSIMETLGIKELEVVEEVLQGIPLCTSSGFLFITKAGGFGTEDTLIDLYRFLKNREW